MYLNSKNSGFGRYDWSVRGFTLCRGIHYITTAKSRDPLYKFCDIYSKHDSKCFKYTYLWYIWMCFVAGTLMELPHIHTIHPTTYCRPTPLTFLVPTRLGYVFLLHQCWPHYDRQLDLPLSYVMRWSTQIRISLYTQFILPWNVPNYIK